MNFWVDKKDNSLYFHVYRKPNEFPMRRESPLSDKYNIQRIHFPDYESTGFQENHISFHERGYIHSIDNKGSRYRDGIKGIPFFEIESHLFILAVSPKNPLDMIELSRADPSRDIRIHIPDDMQPFILHFGLHKKECPLSSELLSKDFLGGRIIVGKSTDKDFDLLIAMTKVDSLPGVGEIDWPPFTLVLKRIG